MDEIQKLLLSTMPLLITIDGYRQLMVSAFPMQKLNASGQKLTYGEACKYLETHTWYQYMTHNALVDLTKQLSNEKDDDDDDEITLTDEYDSETLPDSTVAYHRIFGTVTADGYYHFSSKQLDADVKAAENNPSISAHVMHINSPGGEAWYLDRLSETLRKAEKPILTIYENCCCSAAYYIGCHGNKVYALTNNDIVGSIGTMCSFYDFEPFYEKLGIKKIEAYATNSTKKNKMVDDLISGKPDDFIQKVLNPLNEEFMAEVKSQRKEICDLDNTEPVLQGETYYTGDAIDIGLIDAKKSFAEVVAEAAELGKIYQKSVQLKNSTYNFV